MRRDNLRKAILAVPCLALLLTALAPAAQADRKHPRRPRKSYVRLQDGKMDAVVVDGKGDEEKGDECEPKGFGHKDYADDSLRLGYFDPICDYPWARTLRFERFRMAPDRSLEFFCPPLSTHLYYPELYPRSYVAGGSMNIDY
jgi:hypothetical protein